MQYVQAAIVQYQIVPVPVQQGGLATPDGRQRVGFSFVGVVVCAPVHPLQDRIDGLALVPFEEVTGVNASGMVNQHSGGRPQLILWCSVPRSYFRSLEVSDE